MKVKYALFCEAANIANGQNLNMLGTFGTIVTDQFPIIKPYMCFVASIRFYPEEAGKHIIKIMVSSGNRDSIIPRPLEMCVETPHNEMTHNLIAGFNGLKFDTPGDYYFDIEIDGSIVYTEQLMVLQSK